MPPQPRSAPPQEAAPVQPQRGGRGGGRGANRRPSGRERHDEKITVYVSAEELMDLEHARLVLRGEHGLAVDRGRIVREAVAVVLADVFPPAIVEAAWRERRAIVREYHPFEHRAVRAVFRQGGRRG